MATNPFTKEEMSKWADYWYYQIGVNTIPVVSKAKTAKKDYEWKQWQINELPEETFQLWKAQNAFADGIGIIVGNVWRGPNKGKYFTFIDCDNKAAIEALCTRNGKHTTLEEFAKRFIVEQHEDNPNKAHIYFYSSTPFPKKSTDVLEKEMMEKHNDVDVPLFEVKGRGSHGIAFCTPSMHKDGHRYQIIGTADSIILDEENSNIMLTHLDNICRENGLHYLENSEHPDDPTKIPMKSLFDEDIPIYEGNNRHEGIMRLMESLILRNRKIMKPEFIKEVAEMLNQRKCKPPLDSVQFEKQWKAANEYTVKILKQQGDSYEPTPKEREQQQIIEDQQNQIESMLLEQFHNNQQPKHNTIPIYKISELGVDMLKEHVIVKGTVIGISELVPSWRMVKWMCKICNSANKSDKFDQSKAPKACAFCGEAQGFIPEIDMDMEPKLNQQTILLQDGTYTLSCILNGPGSQMFKVKPGQKVLGLGMQKYKIRLNRNKSENEWVKYFDLLDIKAQEGMDVLYTDDDIQYFKDLAGSVDDFIEEILLPSFAPHVRGRGMDQCKLVCIYTLASQGNERPFNSILLGPPAKGKTQLTEYTAELSHHSNNVTTFVNTTTAGLTTETVTDPVSGSKMAKPGLFGTYKLVAFTDLNGVMDHSDGKKLLLSLNDALERKVLTSGKAGGAANFEGRCAVLMDSNNFQATWYYDEPISHNLQFAPKSFLSRIDLIGLIPQGADKQHNKEVARANYQSYMDKENPVRLHEGDWADEKTGKPRLGFDNLRKFFFYIFQQPLPRLPDDNDLMDFFGDNYNDVIENDKEYLVDGRYNRTALILARIMAKLLFKPMADKSLLERAIKFVNNCKNIETIVPKTGALDANYLSSSASKSEILELEEVNKLQQWITACNKASAKTEDGYFTVNELTNELFVLKDSKWTDILKIHEAVGKFDDGGKMMCDSKGRYKWLNQQQ